MLRSAVSTRSGTEVLSECNSAVTMTFVRECCLCSCCFRSGEPSVSLTGISILGPQAYNVPAILRRAVANWKITRVTQMLDNQRALAPRFWRYLSPERVPPLKSLGAKEKLVETRS